MTELSHSSDTPTPSTYGAMEAFEPVDTATRHDGWTAERQRAFITTLADTGCVTEAAKAAGMNARTAYRLRRRSPVFNRAWEEAVTVASQALTSIAFERAIHGASRQIWKDGELAYEERAPSDRMLMFLLRHLDPSRYGKLSGLLPVQIDDPRQGAMAALPRLVDALEDDEEGEGGSRERTRPIAPPRQASGGGARIRLL